MTREQKLEGALKLIADTFDKNHGRQDEKLLDIPKIALAALSAPKAEAEEPCPVCAKPFAAGDTCATDIELGKCHAECLAGSPTVDLETGEPVDGPIDTFPHVAPKAEAASADEFVARFFAKMEPPLNKREKTIAAMAIGFATAITDEAVYRAVRAHDREDPSHRGEPDPWEPDYPEEEMADRMFAMRLALLAAFTSKGEGD